MTKKISLRQLQNLSQKTLVVLLAVRFFVACLSCFLPLNNPHVWRQSDTLGVALRYWLRWSLEVPTKYSLLPAVLNSGDHYAITPMEFPILNMFGAPFFYFGPYWGRVTSHLFLCFVLLILLVANFKIWKNILVEKVPSFEMILLLPMFSYANPVAWHFMPDFLSVLFCLTAIGFSWNKEKSLKVVLFSFLFSTLGLLIKPTSIAVFLLLLLQVSLRKKFFDALWLFPATALSLLYYTLGVKYIESKQDIDALFFVQHRPILSSLKDFFNDLPSLWDILNFHAFVPYTFLILFLICSFFYWKEKTFPFLKLWLIFLFQIILIAALDGKHAYIHFYYFISLSVTCAFIAIGVWYKSSSIFLKFILFSLFIGRFIDILHSDLKPFAKSISGHSLYAQCENLIHRHPEFPWKQNYVFRTEKEAYPELGLCFGEREGSQINNYGFANANGKILNECRIIDKELDIALITCK